MDKQRIAEIHDKYERLLAKNSLNAPLFWLKHHTVLNDYTPEGKYVGTPRNENGWTP